MNGGPGHLHAGPDLGPDLRMDPDLRVGDAERDEVAVALHDHFVQGRLTRDELDERLEAALSAKTVGDLRVVTRDLPGPPGRARPHQPAPHPPADPRHFRGHHRFHPAPLLFVILLIAAITGGSGSWPFFGIVRAVLLVWLVLGVFGIMRHRRRWHRPGGQRGPRS
jgi:hypothetical protein